MPFFNNYGINLLLLVSYKLQTNMHNFFKISFCGALLLSTASLSAQDSTTIKTEEMPLRLLPVTNPLKHKLLESEQDQVPVTIEMDSFQKDILRRITDIYQLHVLSLESQLEDNPLEAETHINDAVNVSQALLDDYPEIRSDRRFVELSRAVVSEYRQFYGISEEKIKVVYQGCNPLFYQTTSAENLNQTRKKHKLPKDFIICVGTIEERKNGLQILKALVNCNINIPIVFVGRPTKYKELLLDEISKNDQLKNQVIFIENASNGELKELYQLAQLSVYPSIFEGFGIPVLESIAAGTPVITNKAGCFKEAGGEAAFYIDPNNSEEFGSAIKLLTENTEALNRLKLAATHHLENFKEAELAAQLMSIYKGA